MNLSQLAEQADVNWRARRTLVALAELTEEGLARPMLADLKHRTGWSTAALNNQLAALEAHGYLRGKLSRSGKWYELDPEPLLALRTVNLSLWGADREQ